MKSLYYILNNKTNKYIKVIKDCIESNDITVESFNLAKEEVNSEVEIYNLNWYESVFPRNIIKAYIQVFKRVRILNNLKKQNKKIIWTIHNKEAHEEKYKKISRILIRQLCRKSDYIVIHCKDTVKYFKDTYQEFDESKIRYIPHPNYIGVYEDQNINYREIYNIKDDEFVFLFIGQVRAYKNVEMIIDVAKKMKGKKVKFIIAGNPNSATYKNELLSRIDGCDNIIPIFRFIEDNELTSLVKSSNMMLFPYDINSSLNSGSVILSFSTGRTVICPNIGTLNDIDDKSLFYSYDYKTEQEHEVIFETTINDVVKEWEEGRLELIKLEEALIDLMKKDYSHELVGKLYGEIYLKG